MTPGPALVAPDVTWAWSWVPPADHDEEEARAWHADVAATFTGWTVGTIAELTRALPPELRAGAAASAVGGEVATWLRGRTVGLPPWTYVAWGAVFLTPERPRWAPVVAVVELREAPDGSEHLMDVVGAAGLPQDARPPVVDFVTTDAGDGVRVTALARGPRGEAYVRVDAALRLEATDDGGPVDVVVSTRADELGMFGLIGVGVEQLLHVVAASSLPLPPRRVAPDGRVPSAGRGRTP